MARGAIMAGARVLPATRFGAEQQRGALSAPPSVFYDIKTSVLPSSLLPRTGAFLQRFHALVVSHDVTAVDEFLAEHGKEFDPNGQNLEGHTALHLAVIGDDLPMVEHLLNLKPRLAIGNVLLHAVEEGNLIAIELMLEHKRTMEAEAAKEGRKIEVPDCVDYTEDITPLILACHNDNFNLVRILLENGHTVARPHPVNCLCSEKCRLYRREKESLNDSIARINRYRSICSPSYLCLASVDPVLDAFELNQELREYAEHEPEFKHDYTQLAQKCAIFAVDLLSLCRTTDEVTLLLSAKIGFEKTLYKREKFSRVIKAVDYNLKSFVTHPNCQQVLCNEWLQEFSAFRSVHFLGICYLILYRTFLYPFIAVICWVCPWTKLARSFQTPVNKYLSSAASYLVFLIFILVQNYMKMDSKLRGPPETGFEIIIIIFVIAMWLKTLLYLWFHGIEKYLQLVWNVYDCVMLSLFSATFICWALSAYQVQGTPGSQYWNRLIWSQWDPCIIGELFFAFAVLFAFLKLLFFFQFNSSIGTLMVSMVQMIRDTASFLAILLTIIASFAVGLCNIFQPYHGNVRKQDEATDTQSSSFTSIISALASLYWGFFGYTGPENAKVVVPEQKVVIGNQTLTVYNSHKLTETVGTLFLAAFYLFCVVTLMNMLVAMLTSAYTTVLLNADTEWKFNRTKIWLSFFVSEDYLPIPFNLLPKPITFYQIAKWLVARIRQKKEDKPKSDAEKVEPRKTDSNSSYATFNCIRCCHFGDHDEEKEVMEGEAYRNMMSKLIQRYLTAHPRKAQQGDPESTGFIAIVNKQLRELTSEVKQLKKELMSSRLVRART